LSKELAAATFRKAAARVMFFNERLL
jgi:hypothetical protein